MSPITSMPLILSVFFLLACSAATWPLLFDSLLLSKDAIEKHHTDRLAERDQAAVYFSQQFANPKDVLTILLLIGGDVVQKAVAQLTGGPHATFTPVVFSFGWVAYAVKSMGNAVGNGTFLPQPDYPGTVVVVGSGEKLGSGDRRENQSWVIGRLIRDLELRVEEEVAKEDKMLLESGLMISFFKLDPCQGKPYKPLKPKKDWLWWSFTWGITLQLAIAVIPWSLYGNWSICLVTGAGNLLAFFTASLPSMRKENIGFRRNSRQTYAITQGNGHRHVFIITPDTLDRQRSDGTVVNLSTLPYLDEMAISANRADPTTRALSVILAILWIMFLIAMGSLESDTWFLFGAGMVGMMLNILVSASHREPEAHGIPLIKQTMKLGFIDAINQQRPKVREVLLDLERNCPGAGHALRPVFFNGLLNDKDKDWEKDDVNWPKAQERLTQMEVLGERHPETIQNLADLAATYQQQDRLREAEGIYVRVLQLWKKTLGQKNPDTVQNIVDLAAIYYLQGGSKDAEEIYVNVLGLRKDGICKKHPDTIRKIAELAAKYHMKNQSTQLENVKVEVLRLQKEVLGEKHHETIQTMKGLAAIYNEQGKAAAALDIEENVLRLQEEGHPHTMLSIARLASEYQQRQKVKTR